MQLEPIFDYLPLWGILLATLAIVLLSVEGGFRLGRFNRRRSPDSSTPLSTIVAAALGLVAFLLAFTFGSASSRFDARRQAVLEEANAVGTAYLRAQLLPEPERTKTRDLLRQYVDVRLEGARSGKIQQAIQQSETLHDQLWALVVAAGARDPGSIMIGLFIQSLNDVIDLHAIRVAVGLRARIPTVIWAVLYLTTVLAMVLMGYLLGLNDSKRSFAIPAFALTFSTVLFLIADLDHPQEGLITISQQAISDVRNSMTR